MGVKNQSSLSKDQQIQAFLGGMIQSNNPRITESALRIARNLGVEETYKRLIQEQQKFLENALVREEHIQNEEAITDMNRQNYVGETRKRAKKYEYPELFDNFPRNNPSQRVSRRQELKILAVEQIGRLFLENIVYYEEKYEVTQLSEGQKAQCFDLAWNGFLKTHPYIDTPATLSKILTSARKICLPEPKIKNRKHSKGG